MQITEGVACPVCAGRQMVGHPCGWLAWQHTTECPLRDREDSRHLADLDMLGNCLYAAREATETERQLLALLGHAVPEDLLTEIVSLSPHVFQRRWPALETGGDAA